MDKYSNSFIALIGFIPPNSEGGSGVYTRFPPKLSWNLPCSFSAYFLALRHISPASVFHRFMPRYSESVSVEVRVKSSFRASTVSLSTQAEGEVMIMSSI